MILPEYVLKDPLSCAHLSSLDKYRLHVSSQNRNLAMIAKRRDSYLTSWPMFVFNQYDLNDIVDKIRNHFRQLNIGKFILFHFHLLLLFNYFNFSFIICYL